MMHGLAERVKALARIKTPLTRRKDFGAFWKRAVKQAAEVPLDVKSRTVSYPVPTMTVHDLSYAGLDGTRVAAWLLLPAAARQPVPLMVVYHGAGGSRGFPSHHATWIDMGFAVMAIDVRLQGGDTGSVSGFASGNAEGYLSIGLLDPSGYYLCHVWTDSLRAVQVASEWPGIDAGRIVVNGGSQGGGISLAMAALRRDVKLCLTDVPSSAWLEKRVVDRAGGCAPIAQYLRKRPEHLERVEATLSYFDLINHAENIRCPVFMSVGLKDTVCPPENAFAAYNRIRSPKEAAVYPFGEHDGGGAYHHERKLERVARWLKTGK